MEADDRCAREDAGERAEAAERPHRVRLRERADGRGRARDRVVRRELRCSLELPLGRDRGAEPPEREP